MSDETPKFSQDDLIVYVENQISETLRSGLIDPTIGLECFLFALKPDLTAALRQLASLDPVGLKQALDLVNSTRPSEATPAPKFSTH